MSKIPKHLIEKINDMPEKPGVYQMKDFYGDIIYIGKSKSLKSRVKSYFNTEHKWEKVKRMVFYIHDINFIVTDTHLEAQVLECTLIKKIRPMYNVQFKNHEKYKYLKINDSYKNKPMSLVDEKEDKNCIGPFRSKNILSTIISFFENIYPILKQEDSYDFTYNPLPQPMKKDTFKDNMNHLIEIFSKKESMEKFLHEINNKMNQAALEFQFEKASIYRDIIYHLKYLEYAFLNTNDKLIDRKILMGEKLNNGYKIFYISNNRIIKKKKYHTITKEDLERFIIEAKEVEKKRIEAKDDKSDLDFRNIISSEVKNLTGKVILSVNNKYNIDKFLQKLIKIN